MNKEQHSDKKQESLVLKTAWIPCVITVVGLAACLLTGLLHLLGIGR